MSGQAIAVYLTSFESLRLALSEKCANGHTDQSWQKRLAHGNTYI